MCGMETGQWWWWNDSVSLCLLRSDPPKKKHHDSRVLICHFSFRRCLFCWFKQTLQKMFLHEWCSETTERLAPVHETQRSGFNFTFFSLKPEAFDKTNFKKTGITAVNPRWRAVGGQAEGLTKGRGWILLLSTACSTFTQQKQQPDQKKTEPKHADLRGNTSISTVPTETFYPNQLNTLNPYFTTWP